MISDGNIPLTGQANIDDLPRTLRREHEARAREARERDGQNLNSTMAGSAHASADTSYQAAQSYEATAMPGEPYPSVVKALDIPFGHLVTFCLKAVLAAIPALFLLVAILLGMGVLINTVAPNLPLFKITIAPAPKG